jgi:hypothetical protein
MSHLDGTTRRAVLAHAVGALAVALPWPLLLVLVAEHTDQPWLLGLAGSARMLPYVAISWLTARLADAMRRDLIVRATLLLRGLLLVATALAVVADRPWAAVACCTAAVAVATPAYPAMVAAMPGIAGAQRRPATELLVTVEVGAFVVGVALGGLMLGPATRDLLPWVPVAMTLLAAALIRPVSMPAPARGGERGRRPSAMAALRRAPAAGRAIAVMAAVNLGISLVALALLPLALDSWSSDATGYGLATGVLGLAALGAPVLRRIGPTPVASMWRALLLVACGILLVVPAPTVGWTLVPLAVAGAAAVGVETAATSVLQEEVPDDVCASVLGINDSVIVSAALVGTLLAPVSIEVVGGGTALGATAAGLALAAWWARSTRTPPGTRLPSVIGEPAREKEIDEDPSTTTAVPARDSAARVPAQRTPADRLLDVGRRTAPAAGSR